MSILETLGNIVGKVAPGIATALGGPLAGSAVKFLSEKLLGKTDGTAEELLQELNGLTPEQMLKIKEMEHEFNLQLQKDMVTLAQGQISINLAEAQSKNLFNSGWRPFIGWTCGTSLVYAAILEPIARFIAKVIYSYSGEFPAIDTQLTLQILIGILGLGGMRTFERFKGVTK